LGNNLRRKSSFSFSFSVLRRCTDRSRRSSVHRWSSTLVGSSPPHLLPVPPTFSRCKPDFLTIEQTTTSSNGSKNTGSSKRSGVRRRGGVRSHLRLCPAVHTLTFSRCSLLPRPFVAWTDPVCPNFLSFSFSQLLTRPYTVPSQPCVAGKTRTKPKPALSPPLHSPTLPLLLLPPPPSPLPRHQGYSVS
jgi:hypothetical protein